MRRRKFIALVATTAVGWPLLAQAQLENPVHRIGVLTGASTPDSDRRLKVFVEELARFGWTEGVKVQFETRRGGGDPDVIRRGSTELGAAAPDVIFAIGCT